MHMMTKLKNMACLFVPFFHFTIWVTFEICVHEDANRHFKKEKRYVGHTWTRHDPSITHLLWIIHEPMCQQCMHSSITLSHNNPWLTYLSICIIVVMNNKLTLSLYLLNTTLRHVIRVSTKPLEILNEREICI